MAASKEALPWDEYHATVIEEYKKLLKQYTGVTEKPTLDTPFVLHNTLSWPLLVIYRKWRASDLDGEDGIEFQVSKSFTRLLKLEYPLISPSQAEDLKTHFITHLHGIASAVIAMYDTQRSAKQIFNHLYHLLGLIAVKLKVLPEKGVPPEVGKAVKKRQRDRQVSRILGSHKSKPEHDSGDGWSEDDDDDDDDDDDAGDDDRFQRARKHRRGVRAGSRVQKRKNQRQEQEQADDHAGVQATLKKQQAAEDAAAGTPSRRTKTTAAPTANLGPLVSASEVFTGPGEDAAPQEEGAASTKRSTRKKASS